MCDFRKILPLTRRTFRLLGLGLAAKAHMHITTCSCNQAVAASSVSSSAFPCVVRDPTACTRPSVNRLLDHATRMHERPRLADLCFIVTQRRCRELTAMRTSGCWPHALGYTRARRNGSERQSRWLSSNLHPAKPLLARHCYARSRAMLLCHRDPARERLRTGNVRDAHEYRLVQRHRQCTQADGADLLRSQVCT
jgi:hypothetical protein